jgi:hypothetical protein
MLRIRLTASKLDRKMSIFLCAHFHRKLPPAQKKRRKTTRILNHRLLLGKENPYLRILQSEG